MSEQATETTTEDTGINDGPVASEGAIVAEGGGDTPSGTVGSSDEADDSDDEGE